MSYIDYVKRQPCLVCMEPPPSDPHHLKSKGAGGPDEACIPLCRTHHREYHTTTHAKFERAHGFPRKRGLWFFAWRVLHRYHNQPEAQ